MIRIAKACDAPRLIVPDAALSVTVEVPAAKVEDAPDVSQEPDAEMEPLVREIVFAEASFIVTPATEMEDVVPMSVPPPETTRFAPPVMVFPEVVSVPVMESVPVTSIALVMAIVPEMVRL
jgi:hypothetical protein